MYENADPFIGILELNSAYINAVMNATVPAKMKLMKRDGPAYYAATPVSENIPAPMVFPIPNIIKLVSDSF